MTALASLGAALGGPLIRWLLVGLAFAGVGLYAQHQAGAADAARAQLKLERQQAERSELLAEHRKMLLDQQQRELEAQRKKLAAAAAVRRKTTATATAILARPAPATTGLAEARQEAAAIVNLWEEGAQ